ncbi:hypothetical protein [Nocardioides flavescens]|uniref:Alpha/beta hydrolase n=1 Tax=Nocardioides flavescens TaxID=2691959 RepID=A0A6L7EY87_9ACTN|nr:hypothetical protein [Nocardioides flavescens]MXG89129.1 hypothetical protein [Nocardioides flavescens]
MTDLPTHVAARADGYDALLSLADELDRTGAELRTLSGLGAEVLRDPAVTDSADLSPTTWTSAEDDLRAATTGRHGLLARSVELDADALVVRATVLTYQWIDELREAAYQSLGAVAGRAVGYLAPHVALGGAVVAAGLIETDALDRDAVTAYLSELAVQNPELMDHVTSGGGGLLDSLQMRSVLTAGFVSGEPGRQAARGGLRAIGVETMRRDSGAALRDIAGGLLSPLPAEAAGATTGAVAPPPRPASLADLMTTLEGLDGRLLVHRTAPARYVVYLGRPPAVEGAEADDDAPPVRLVSGDLSPYAAEVAQTVAAAVSGDEDPRVMLVGAGAGGVIAAQLAAMERPAPFTVDQVVTAGAPAAQVPRLPVTTRMLALEDRADPVALLGSLVNAGDPQRTTVVFDAAGTSSESVYVCGARVADAAPSAELRAELDRLRLRGFLS